MMQTIQPYLDAILQEQAAAWAIVCILYILAGVFVRGWFIGPLFSSLKTLDKDHAHKIRKGYLKSSLLGWIFFLFPLALIAIYWRKDSLPIRLTDGAMIGAGIASYILAVILHLQAFASASVDTIRTMQAERAKLDL